MAQTPYQMKPIGDSSLKNIIINGNFDFWQRGTSVSVVASQENYQADRFTVYRSYGNAPTYSRSTNVPTQAQSGFQSLYSLLLTANATPSASPGSTDFTAIRYKMEGLDYQAIYSRDVRIQFWVKSSVAGTYSFAVTGVTTTRSYCTTYSITSANVWQKVSIDLTLDTGASYPIDNTGAITLWWTLAAGSSLQGTTNAWQPNGTTISTSTATASNSTWYTTANATFQLAQVALIPGKFSSATDIPHRRVGATIGDELRMCQRYYERFNQEPGPDYYTNLGVGSVFSANNVFIYWSFRVPKRAVPSATVEASGTFGVHNTLGFSADEYYGGSTNGIRVRLTKISHGLTIGQGLVVYFDAAAQTNGYIGVTAEL
jgi:hypothetical protein